MIREKSSKQEEEYIPTLDVTCLWASFHSVTPPLTSSPPWIHYFAIVLPLNLYSNTPWCPFDMTKVSKSLSKY